MAVHAPGPRAQGRRGADEPLGLGTEVLGVVEALVGFGTWEWDPPTGRWWISDRLRVVLGLDDGPVSNLGDLLDRIHPLHRTRAERAVRDAIGHGDGFVFEASPAGHPDRHLRWSGSVDRSAEVGLRMTGVVLDVTTEIAARERAKTYVAQAAHELRNTAASIVQAAPTLREVVRQAPEHADRLIDILLDQSQRLSDQCHTLLETNGFVDLGSG